MGLDSSGNQIWNRTWGSGYDDANYDVIVYNYSRIYTIGEYDFDVVFGTNQLPIHCFNSSGSIIFSDTYISLSVHGYGMTIDTNLANPIIYIAGKSKVSNPSALLVAYYLNGTRKNSTKYNGPTDDIGYAVGVDSKNFIYVGGVTNSSGDGSWDVQILKYDTSFHLKWNITWGTPYDDTLNDLYIDKNDNIYVCGETDTGGGVISFLMMFNVTGSLQWIRLWSNYQIEVAKSITEDKDGNLVIAGYVLNNYNDYDVMITAFDKSGLQLWYDIWGSNGDDYGYGICADTNGSIFICGKTNSTGMGDADGDLLVLKFSNIQNTPPTTTTTSTSTIPGFNYFAVIISVGFIIVVVFGIKKFPSRRKFPVNL
ncbi:MAG: SBBP repeat-containing protein [Candidatus Helarchaeota archaeon]